MTGRARLTAALAAAVLALAGCGESPEDEARDDGEDVGEAALALYSATSTGQAEAAQAELREAVDDLDADVREHVADQIATQRDALEQVAATYEGQGFDAARTALRSAVQDGQAQAAAFGSSDDAIANEFWRGVQDGFQGLD